MRTLRTIAEVRAALAGPREQRHSVALVPTMGALHRGHRALIERAHAECDHVVVSLFVNPRQFDDAGDLAAYPRDEEGDAALAEEAGADLLFAPAHRELYPPGFATTVAVGGPAEGLEGAHRGGAHFEGVATVVLKLLLIVNPDAAYFGQKDAQQLAVVRRLATDLALPTRIEAVPTVREPDGLALSSRNARLMSADRPHALALSRALEAARAAVAAGEQDAAAVATAGREAMAALQVEPEYLELVDPDTFAPLTAIDGEALVAVAARVGGVRLIDNQLLTSDGRPS